MPTRVSFSTQDFKVLHNFRTLSLSQKKKKIQLVLDLIFCSEDDLISDVVVGECLAGRGREA